MKNLRLILKVCFLCALVTTASAQVKLAQTGLQFLKVDVSARAAAMGGAYQMIGTGADVIFYNPAGITWQESDYNFFASRVEWIADINYHAFGLVKKLGFGSVGLSFQTADYGDEIMGTQIQGDGFVETGVLDVGAYAAGIAVARQFTDRFSVGVHIKYASQKLGSNALRVGGDRTNEVSGLAYDIGTIFYPGYKSLRVGMSVRNFSQQFKYEEEEFQLPLTFTISAAMDVTDLMNVDSEMHSFLFAIDAIHPRDFSERLHFGGEYTFMDMFALRGGYKYNYDAEGLTAGAGFKYGTGGVVIQLDYSYGDTDVFGAVNRFAFNVSF